MYQPDGSTLRTLNSRTTLIFIALFSAIVAPAYSQDSVDVTFRWSINGQSGYSVPGEFNGWDNAAWPMQYQGGDLWIRNARLPVNPMGGSIPGAYQYKFYYSGASPWPNDPLNHRVNAADNDNSYLYIKDPTVYHFLPNQRSGLVTTTHPTISAYVYPRVGGTVDTSTLSLRFDGTTIDGIGSSYNVSTRQLVYTTPFEVSDGGHQIILTAGTTSDTVSFTVLVGSPPVVPMPAYARHGVTLPSTASGDSTTFRLRVGGTNVAFLRVAPLGEPVQSQPAIIMRKDPASDNWWMNVDLPEGTYEYLFQTENGTFLHDPWGRETGTYGSRFSTGSEGLTADDYVWQSDSYERPPLNKICIYELHVGEFGGGYYGLGGGEAGFEELTSLIPYFDSLGVNAIELMPINDFGNIGPSGHSWGYDISHYFALEPSYGTPRELKVLVDSAHARGIAVILDVVFNHLNDPSPLWQMHPDDVANPYFKPATLLRYNEDPLFFFRDLDHWTDETQELVYEVLKMWIDEYRVDGFRYDFTQGVGWNIAEPTRGILGWANRISQEYGGSIYQIAEHLPESPALVLHSGITGGWHDSYRDEVFDEARFMNTPLTDFENLVIDLDGYPGNDIPSTPTRYAGRTGPVNGNVNHDEQGLLFEMYAFQGVDTATALVRDRLYSTFMFTSVGIPMLWEGIEFSAPRGWLEIGDRLAYRPVEWEFLDTDRGRTHFDYYSRLVFQRLNNPALYLGVLHKMFRYTSQKVLVWGYTDAVYGAAVMAVANLSGTDQTVTNVPWLSAGTWYDIWDQSVFVADGVVIDSFHVPAFTARVYSNTHDSLLVGVSTATVPSIPVSFALRQNFPNPFNPSTTIVFDVPSASKVTITVFDVLGRAIATLADDIVSPGVHSVRWNGRTASGAEVAGGVYFVRMNSADGFNATRKMLLLK